jgi:hypothetical protein
LDSTLVGVSPCTVYAAWGATLRSAYPTYESLCRECTADEWRDPVTGGCRQRAEIAVRASSISLKMTLVKTRSNKTVEAEVEVRLKSGNVDEIQCSARPSTGSGWLSLGVPSGSVSSARPVATLTVVANGTGLSDTAAAGPIRSSIEISCEANMTLGDLVFVGGNRLQAINVDLFIAALPYIDESHVAITSSSSGRAVKPGEPVDAGDRLVVSLKAFDADRLPISRKDLQLTVEVKGKLNGVQRAPLEPDITGTNVYTATIPENWIKTPETVESDVPPSQPLDVTLHAVHSPTGLDCLACCDPRSNGWSSHRACPTSPRTSRS